MNPFDIGDKVAFIHEKSKGIIIGINGNIINVHLEEEDMDIEVDVKALMLIEKKAPQEITLDEQKNVSDKNTEDNEEELSKKLDTLKQTGIGHKTKSTLKKDTSKIPTEIDLHWDVLKRTQPNYSNIDDNEIDEIFRIQRLEFENFFLQALSNNLSMITIIHGIGAGKLRDYIHSYIKRHEKSIDSYQVMNDGGLTQVIFKLS